MDFFARVQWYAGLEKVKRCMVNVKFPVWRLPRCNLFILMAFYGCNNYSHFWSWFLDADRKQPFLLIICLLIWFFHCCDDYITQFVLLFIFIFVSEIQTSNHEKWVSLLKTITKISQKEKVAFHHYYYYHFSFSLNWDCNQTSQWIKTDTNLCFNQSWICEKGK